MTVIGQIEIQCRTRIVAIPHQALVGAVIGKKGMHIELMINWAARWYVELKLETNPAQFLIKAACKTRRDMVAKALIQLLAQHDINGFYIRPLTIDQVFDKVYEQAIEDGDIVLLGQDQDQVNFNK